MRPVQQLVHSRARVRQRYGLFPLAVGRAVRTSIVAINVIDLFLSMAIWGTTTTVRLAG